MCEGQDCLRVTRYYNPGESPDMDVIVVENQPPDVERFSAQLLREADPRWLNYDGETIRITAGGIWTYRVVDQDQYWVTGRLVHDEADNTHA
jgi:hypothetical protein